MFSDFTAIHNVTWQVNIYHIILSLTVRGPTLFSESVVCRRQILLLKSISALKE